MTKVIFSDFDLQFRRHPLTGDVLRLTEADAIKQSLRNLFSTGFYERKFQPWIGSSFRHILFKLDDDVTLQVAHDTILLLVQQFEKRISIDELTLNRTDDGRVIVRMSYQIVNMNVPDTFTYILERIR